MSDDALAGIFHAGNMQGLADTVVSLGRQIDAGFGDFPVFYATGIPGGNEC